MILQTISEEALCALQAKGETLEQDERGIKVSLLPNGHILKVFRMRSRFSGALLFSYAKRFIRNAKRLNEKGITTVEPQCRYEIVRTNQSAVEYQPIAGETIRKLLKQGKVTDAILAKLGEFIAELHQKGIYFRSLHLGNVVCLLDGNMGLIDIADMRIYPWPLHFFTRQRNFDRIKKYDEDMQFLNAAQRQLLMQSYIAITAYQGHKKAILRAYLDA